MESDVLLCLCNAISEAEVRVAIRAGARTVDEVGDACLAGTGCGSCRGTIATLLAEESRRRGQGLYLSEALMELLKGVDIPRK
ncbi:MAG: (2Fe-2S)-binding protein [Myxococcales bacterium]|nr:(2Fe-2S)-binding protein [Myxococcales bacterium]